MLLIRKDPFHVSGVVLRRVDQVFFSILLLRQEANKTLEKIQKSLEDYLETKRMGFPRFETF